MPMRRRSSPFGRRPVEDVWKHDKFEDDDQETDNHPVDNVKPSRASADKVRLLVCLLGAFFFIRDPITCVNFLRGLLKKYSLIIYVIYAWILVRLGKRVYDDAFDYRKLTLAHLSILSNLYLLRKPLTLTHRAYGRVAT